MHFLISIHFMRKFFTALFFSLVCVNSSLAQQRENNYRAVHWGLDEGLSQGETYHVIKDANGFLWIGTHYGLNRFDGNTFKVYLHERNNNKSLIDNDVRNGFVEDSLHNIWIGSNSGVSRYNIRTDDFTNFFPDTIFNDDPEISPFWATKNEVFCIESETLITAYNIHSSSKRVIGELETYKRKIIGVATPYSIFDSSSNSVWCLVNSPDSKNGLLQIILSSGKKNFFSFPFNSNISPNNDAEAMCYDAARKCIWVNYSQGLLQFTLNTNQFHHIKALDEIEHTKDYCRFVGITLDTRSRVWFSTKPKGIIVYNPANESLNFPFPADSTLEYNVSDANACIYYDRDNIIWYGFWKNKGVYALVPFLPFIKHYTTTSTGGSLNSDLAVQAVDAGENQVWVGTEKGINILDLKKGIFRSLQQKDLQGLQTPDGLIAAITIDTLTQKAWLYTSEDIYKENMLTKKCERIPVKDLNNKITPLRGVPAVDGKEFFFSSYDSKGQHISVLNLDDDTAHEILFFDGFRFDPVIIPVKNNLLFFKGVANEKDNRSYENKNGKWVQIHTPIDSMRWTSLAYIKNTYWVAGENKLLHLDNNFHIIQIYSAENGLSEQSITGLIDDNNGNIWFHTYRSIQELNTATGEIKTMSEFDGFEKQDFDLSPLVDKDTKGNIYYFGDVGFNMITPGNFIFPVSGVYLKSLTINQKPFPLKSSINQTDTISLKYNQTKIEIETGVIDFYSKGKSRIRYKLEGKGITEKWQYAPYYYTIRYDGLQPGSYKLIIQASNASNEFNGPEKNLFINITPAFWNTWWFRTIAVLFVSVLLYSFIRWRIHQTFKSKLLRSEKEKQLAELKDKASQLEMETLRSQMNPHFIFNCLSSINHFILKNKTEEASDYLTKFSRLIRMVLNNSKQSFISLEDELETLRLYLEMERLRFKNSFEYSFTYTNYVEASNIFIPPLLLQPFAENAIWHGLMHKHEKGFLNFDFKTEDKFLTCIVTDNGIGREQAELLKSKSAEKQKSMGLKITTERLSLLNSNSNEQTFFTVEDLIDENGNAMGTRVHLKIYFKEMMEV